ncbi:tyrosine-type recombinase/integrase [Desulforhopalus sp. IMCC35007]|uniref:tyrosine-type recombinase/integrase n=1 Tax=Desulforhopalus sp. IMCC35007 TaxID=2569543 RepID=UPI0010AE0F82|nr:tyrosine-type recombinase/integrase [Desulforhopalus sp. IMCC35007]TKB12304.1 integrase [Desulforhopalus sp. IMCC35007]
MKTFYKWKSGIAEAAQNYITLKRQCGMKYGVQERYLRQFDTFHYNNGFEGITLTKEMVNDFIYDHNERPVSHHNKEVLMRDFAIYLADRGHHVYVAKVKTQLIRRKFIPHICTDDEIRRLFRAIDNYPQARRSYRNTVDPVLFRFLYGTGVRISEAVNLVLNDINVESGIVTIRAAKNMKDRLLPMADSLTRRIIIFVNGFHRYSDNKMWLFPSLNNGKIGRMDKTTAYTHFRDYLLMADIPHTAVGPRVHSLRHGFAVKCLKKWVLDGNDLTVLLPYLSAYMGHSNFRATQYYLRLTSDLYPEIVRRVEAEFGYVVPEGGVIYDES